VDPRAEELAGKRLRIFAWVCLVWGVILIVRLIDLQVVHHANYVKYAQSQQVRKVEVKAPRGTLYDRSGEVLAMSVEAESVVVNPLRIPDASVAADLLARQLGMDPKPLVAKIEDAKARKNGFLYIKRRITDQEAERLRSYNLGWIEFRDESIRVYPREERAAHVVGSVDFDEQGNNGVERSLNKYLRGTPGEMRTVADVKKAVFSRNVFNPPQPGRNVTLTIDERIQYVAERALKEAVHLNNVKTGSIVVMNPTTGEILAMTSYPTFNPNDRIEPDADLKPRLNLAVSAPFEPGSVFKVITIAAALETTNITPHTIIPCGNGRMTLFKRVIRDHDPYSALSVEDVLAKSSNIGAINIGLRVGPQRLWEYVRRFGFGSKTGVSMPAEESGWLRNWQKWHPAAIGSIAMGHEIITTTLQLARAASVVANGGMLVKPRLVLKATRVNHPAPGEPIREEVEQIEKEEAPVRVIKPETAITMRRMMEHVVLAGTGKKAKLNGYTSGGKTGSAQIYDPVARAYTHKYNASFMGFAPVNNPALVVVVTLNGASKYGGAVAAPVFAEVAGAALRFLDVPRDLPEDVPATKPAKEDPPVNDLALAELSTPILPEEVVDVAAMGPELPPEMIPTGPKVPNFRGMTKRQVIEESSALGMAVQIAGAGIARRQEPRPGAVLRPGETVRVQFAR
jgi:cell division protein FtsI (penicillin-binding protein 3)